MVGAFIKSQWLAIGALLVALLGLLFGDDLAGRLKLNASSQGTVWPSAIVCGDIANESAILKLHSIEGGRRVEYSFSSTPEGSGSSVVSWGASLFFDSDGDPLPVGDTISKSYIFETNLVVPKTPAFWFDLDEQFLAQKFGHCGAKSIVELAQANRALQPFIKFEKLDRAGKS